MSDDFLRFEGRDANEAEEFIRSVQVRAFSANRMQDDVWKSQLAATAFTGQALRWYRTLSASVKNNWEELQDAILRHYESSGSSEFVHLHLLLDDNTVNNSMGTKTFSLEPSTTRCCASTTPDPVTTRITHRKNTHSQLPETERYCTVHFRNAAGTRAVSSH